jgi:phosphoglycerate kinase
MSDIPTLDDAALAGKRVLVRVDLNVPMDNGKVSDATRIDRIVPTLREIADKGGKVIVLSHFGRPKGGPDTQNSLAPLAPVLAQHIGRSVGFVGDCVGDGVEAVISTMAPGAILLLENTRFHAGEEKNDPAFVEALARNGDVYVNDAFSAAHRAHASTEGVAHRLPAYAGRTMQAEIEAISAALEAPKRPLAAIVGGAKVSTKLELLGNLIKKVDVLIIGGGMANTFLAAQGKNIGASLCERDLLDTARAIMANAKNENCELVLPVDAIVASEFKAHAAWRCVGVDDIGDKDMMLDIGPASIAAVTAALARCATLVWNGPFGAFELPPFDAGTTQVAQAAAQMTRAHTLMTLAGGGDTVSALHHAGVADDFSYISTAGGAFLEWLEGKALPGVEALRR